MLLSELSWDAVWRAWLCIGLLLGLITLGAAAWVGSGATALHDSFIRATASRIDEIAPGKITIGKVLVAHAAQTMKAAIAPWKLIGTPDIDWMKSILKEAKYTTRPADRQLIYEALGEVSGSREKVLETLHGNEMRWTNDEIIERVSLAHEIADLRALSREHGKLRAKALWHTIRNTEASIVWRPLGSKLLDFVGRGTAGGLLLAAAAPGVGASSLMDRIATLTVIGGAVGSQVFVAMVAHALFGKGVTRNGDEKWIKRRYAVGAAVSVPLLVVGVMVIQQGIRGLF